jgi:sugar phosphate isomerase/epimerase
MNLTRRTVLRALGSAAASVCTASARISGAVVLPHPPGGRLGLQLYSLRNELKKDLPGTLKLVRDWGFEEVELAGFPPMTPVESARALRAAGLRPLSTFVDYERLEDDLDGVVRDAKTLGVQYVICGWIPHEKTLTRADVDRAASSFNTWAAAASREKLRFGYHIHGYEFVGSPDGTLMHTLFNRTDPAHVDYEMDVFWVVRGGGDPVALLTQFGRRMPLLHVKDMRRGTATAVTTGQAPEEASVQLGTGTIDLPAVLTAAIKTGVRWYFLEDEHPNAVAQIPRSIEYLRGLKL